MADRTESRKQNYQRLRAAGYSPNDARRLRDQSPVKQSTAIATISRRRPTPESTARTATTGRVTRLNDFRRWTGARQFPIRYLKQIEAINDSEGLDLRDGYGYRVFYWRYVYGYNDTDAREAAEKRDT